VYWDRIIPGGQSSGASCPQSDVGAFPTLASSAASGFGPCAQSTPVRSTHVAAAMRMPVLDLAYDVSGRPVGSGGVTYIGLGGAPAVIPTPSVQPSNFATATRGFESNPVAHSGTGASSFYPSGVTVGSQDAVTLGRAEGTSMFNRIGHPGRSQRRVTIMDGGRDRVRTTC